MDNLKQFQNAIVRDMSEGVMCIGFDGKIRYVNTMAYQILEYDGELVGKTFATCFFEYEENDSFTQAVLDAIYHAGKTQQGFTTYFTGKITKYLNITTSYLKEEEIIGVIVVLNDISELVELRDAVKAMERIKALNNQLELRNKLLSETFGRYLSDEIVKQILETPGGLDMGGKKRNVTIMMADLRGFTAISEQMEPYALVDMLNHYLEEMTEIIERRNGTLIEILGDGILVVFGAPIFTDRHASDAVAAAVEMEQRMMTVNGWNREMGYPALEMGIGLNTGDAVIGNIGSAKRTRYGIIGKNVNLCGRIESYTVGGQIFISPMTKEAIAEELQIEAEHVVFPKGVEKPITLYHVTGIGGEYHVFCKEEELPMRVLESPCAIDFYLIREKHRSKEAMAGELCAISCKQAMLVTDSQLQVFDNIQFETGNTEDCMERKVFAKVMKKNKDGWILHFTATPPIFAEWLEQL